MRALFEREINRNLRRLFEHNSIRRNCRCLTRITTLRLLPSNRSSVKVEKQASGKPFRLGGVGAVLYERAV